MQHIQKIQGALSNVFIASSQLEKLLLPFESCIDNLGGKPLRQMSISEKVKVAQLMIAAFGEQD